MKNLFSIAIALVSINAYAQKPKIETVPPPPPIIETVDTTAPLIEDYEEEVEAESATDYNYELMDDYMPMTEEAPVAYKSNPIAHKAFPNIEKSPDTKAVYKTGTNMLMEDLQTNVLNNQPYSYNSNARYVFVEVTIGTDSTMYNANVLYTYGTEYTQYALKALERLEGKFTPATKKGKAVVSTIIIPIRFEKNNRYH